jgi:hypothetical protein
MGSRAQVRGHGAGQDPDMEQNIKSHREIHPSLRASSGSRSAIFAAGTYLAACGALSIYSMISFAGPYANFAGVIPYLMTAPWSVLPLGVLDPDSTGTLSDITFVALPVIGALINAILIYGAARKLGNVLHRYHLGAARAAAPAEAAVRSWIRAPHNGHSLR